MAALSHQRKIEGSGTDEATWESWLSNIDFNTWEPTECLPGDARLVVVAPHPDDEILACGGLIAMHRANGGDVSVIAVSDGEASHPASRDITSIDLALLRCAESEVGLQRLGVAAAAITRLTLPDGAIAQHTMRLVLNLQRLLKPDDLVVSTWSLDGHPDHEACAFAAALACSMTGAKLIEAPVWMWHWAHPDDLFVPWHRLHRLELTLKAQQLKQSGLAAHASQLDPRNRNGGAVLGAAILARATRAEEYFFV